MTMADDNRKKVQSNRQAEAELTRGIQQEYAQSAEHLNELAARARAKGLYGQEAPLDHLNPDGSIKKP